MSFVGTGTCTLTAHVTPGMDYAAADGTPQSVPVNGFSISTVSLPELTPGKAYGRVNLTEAGAGVSTSPYVTSFAWKKVLLPKGLKCSKAGVLRARRAGS